MSSLLPHSLRALSFAAVVVAAASTSDASQDCLKPDPKTCKIPEDCFYKRQIAMKRALRDAFLSSTLRCNAIAKANGPNPPKDGARTKTAAENLSDDIMNHPERIARQLPRCASTLADPPGFETDAVSCTFQAKDANGRPTDPGKYNTCREFLEASREHEREHVRACKAANDHKTSEVGDASSWAAPHRATCPGAHWNMGAPKVEDRTEINDYADEEADGYTIEVWDLEDRRAAAIHRCTTARAAAAAAAKAASEKAAALKALEARK